MKLKVLARGTALASHLEALDAGVRRFIGRRLDMAVGVDGGFVPLDVPEEVANRAEYRKHVKECDLWAADEATAAVCGVKFDPHFGEAHKPEAHEHEAHEDSATPDH